VGKIYNTPGFPIGKQQFGEAVLGMDGKPLIRQSVRLQLGYHYLTRAMNDKSIQGAMVNKVAESLRRTIGKVAF